MAEGDDEVGYKRPPRHSRFPKGVSGNAGGRPRKLPSLRSELQAELAEEIAVEDGDNRTVTVTKLRGIVRAMVAAALKGNTRAQASIVALTRALSDPADTEDQAGDQKLIDAYIEQEIIRRTKDNSDV